jgi:hypothetical protein
MEFERGGRRTERVLDGGRARRKRRMDGVMRVMEAMLRKCRDWMVIYQMLVQSQGKWMLQALYG